MIELEQRGVVTILRMARGKGNALNLELVEALSDALDRLAGSAARAGILTGQGSVFGAGVDLPVLVEGGAGYVRRFLPLLQRAFEQLATFPKPLVAAVNGHAIAGGAILMLACDQRLLARGTARVGLTEVLVGVEFPFLGAGVGSLRHPVATLPNACLHGTHLAARGSTGPRSGGRGGRARGSAGAGLRSGRGTGLDSPCHVYRDEVGGTPADDRGRPPPGGTDRPGSA